MRNYFVMNDLWNNQHPASQIRSNRVKPICGAAGRPKKPLLLESSHGILCPIKVRPARQFLVPALVAFLLAAPGAGRADPDIKTYIVPKEHPAPVQPMSAMPAADIPVSSAHVTWTTPSTWQELAPTSIRIGNFIVRGSGEAKAETAIFSFPGSVGTELDNVNRWRNELKLPPIEQDKIVSEPVTIDSLPGKLYEINGASNSTVAASLPRDGATWFIKMRGDKDVVASAEPVFRDFLKTIHFSGGAIETPHEAPLETAAANPHGDLTGAAAAPSGSPGDQPNWAVPANWTEKPPGPMLLKSFAATDSSGKAATVTISSFPGDVGGTFANVNRWRGQMGLPPVEQDKLDSVTHPLDTSGGKATMVDFTGTDSKTGQPGRLVAVALPHGGSTWFYKLFGDASAVEQQKETFVKFVQTVQYP